ncbi:MAG TPA: hypothetical protein VM580_31410 [Labilithrix sp.]|jgi:hypothetical protein|nr:hypothetical protein [Labilithrix sp.]
MAPAVLRPRLSGIIVLALLGGFVATMGDAVHVLTGTLAYPEPRMPVSQQAFWVVPGFVAAFLTMGAAYVTLASRVANSLATRESRSSGDIRSCVESLVSFAAIYFLSGFGSGHPTLLWIIFGVTFLVRAAATYERAWLGVLASTLAVSGITVEGLLCSLGLVRYAREDVFYVPYWLGGLYMHGAFALREGMRLFAFGRAPERPDAPIGRDLAPPRSRER